MKIILPAIAIVVLGGAAAANAASPSPGQQQQQERQLRRNAQEIPEVAATATATATITDMLGVDAVDMVMGADCMMMCEVRQLFELWGCADLDILHCRHNVISLLTINPTLLNIPTRFK